MTLSALTQYTVLLTDFVHEHMDTLLAGKRYKEPKEGREESSLDYMPDHNQSAEPGFIGDTAAFRQLVNTFFENFINRDDIVFDLKGHFADIHGKTLSAVVQQDGFYSKKHALHEFEIKILIDVLQAFLDIRDGKTEPFHSFMFFCNKNIIEFKSGHRCPACNQYVTMNIDYELKSVRSYMNVPDCPFIAKIPKNIKVKLEVPSKKLVFLNSPRKFLPLEREDRHSLSINSLLGCIKETEMYAAHNVGFFFVGNCSPSILQKDNEILFTSYDEYDPKDLEKFKEYAYKGYVCTDLWWYTVLDYDLYLKLCSDKNLDVDAIDHTIVDINKTSCTITHNLKAAKEGDHYGLFSKIK